MEHRSQWNEYAYCDVDVAAIAVDVEKSPRFFLGGRAGHGRSLLKRTKGKMMGISGSLTVLKDGQRRWYWRWPARLTDQHAVGITFFILLGINALIFCVAAAIRGRWFDCAWDAGCFMLAVGYIVWVTRSFKEPYTVRRPIALWVTLTVIFSVMYNVAFAQWDTHKTASYEVCGSEKPDGTSQCCDVRLREYEVIREQADLDSNLTCKGSWFPIIPMTRTFLAHPQWLWKWPTDEMLNDLPIVSEPQK